jgi:3-deoxy-D-manno-octulosonic-acid transferase
MARIPFDKRTRNRLLGALAGRYMGLVERTSALDPGSDDGAAILAAHHPAIIAMWHGQFMLVAPLAPKGFEFANMVARHGDAELIGCALETFDMGLVRGGGAAGRRKNRGGTRAFLEALSLLEQGTSITMTADVPPGPARRAGLGIIKLAQKSGRSIIPVAVASSRFLTVDTWSRMTINLPGSRLALLTGEPIHVTADADPATLEAARHHLETVLEDTTRRAYRLVGADPLRATPAAALRLNDPPPPASLPLKTYRTATRALAGAVPLILGYREKKGKEDPARRGERLGHASQARPPGLLIWLHAASVGETNAVLPLMAALRRRKPACRFLLTTGTVTSAAIAARRLGPDDIHQFAPLDVPAYIGRFLDHWRPDIAALTESEIWPNTILAASERAIPLALVNARMSERSYKRWRRYRGSARALIGRFRLILAQNARLARRFRDLGGRDVRITGNLKVDAPPLPVDADALENLATTLENRPILLAASTHRGEEAIVLEAFETLRQTLPETLLVVVPRHPERGPDVTAEAASIGLTTARRSTNEPLTPATNVYVADTLGELGLFYSLSDVAFIGGSLIPHGGQNPLEAIHLATAVLSGPHFENFADAHRELARREAVRIVDDAPTLARTAIELLLDDAAREALTLKARSAMSDMTGALEATSDAFASLLPNPAAASPADPGEVAPDPQKPDADPSASAVSRKLSCAS